MLENCDKTKQLKSIHTNILHQQNTIKWKISRGNLFNENFRNTWLFYIIIINETNGIL